MRFIISPTKTMGVLDQFEPVPHLYFPEKSEELMRVLKGYSLEELTQIWKCSEKLALENYERIQDFDFKAPQCCALSSYTGIQFQNIAPVSLDEQSLEYLQEHLRIVSAVYGLVRPLSPVSPYRLEMQARLLDFEPASLYEFWGADLARALETETKLIVNLASLEYSQAVLPHCGPATTVVHCLFKSQSKGKWVQKSTESKAARGSLVRWCAEHGVLSVDELKAFDQMNFRFNEELSSEDTLVFTR